MAKGRNRELLCCQILKGKTITGKTIKSFFKSSCPQWFCLDFSLIELKGV